MFTIDGFIDDCRTAAAAGVGAVREVVERAVADPSTARTFTPDRGAFDVLHRSDDLTVLHLALPPTIGSAPHDHLMWAVVGVIDGQEDNTFFRAQPGVLETSGGRSLQSGDVLAMGDDTVHAIRNPKRSYLSALHVYGGDLLGAARSEYGPDGSPRPYDEGRIMSLVKAVNEAEDRLGRGVTADELNALLVQALEASAEPTG